MEVPQRQLWSKSGAHPEVLFAVMLTKTHFLPPLLVNSQIWLRNSLAARAPHSILQGPALSLLQCCVGGYSGDVKGLPGFQSSQSNLPIVRLEQLIFNISERPQLVRLCVPLNIVHNLGRNCGQQKQLSVRNGWMFHDICRLFSDLLTAFGGFRESQVKDVEHGFCMWKVSLERAHYLNAAGWKPRASAIGSYQLPSDGVDYSRTLRSKACITFSRWRTYASGHIRVYNRINK